MIIAACLALLVGFFTYLFFPIVQLYRRIEEAAHWESVEAMVLDSRVYRAPGFFSRFINTTVLFYYQYEVDGRKFGSRSVSLFKDDNAQCRRFVSSVKSGAKTPVYYDKEKPHLSCALKPESHSVGMIIFRRLIIFLGALFVGLIIMSGAL